jgi:hypothetical protein
MQKQISYTAVAVFLLLTSCASSKKKALETITTVYTSEVILEKPMPQDSITPVLVIHKAETEVAPLSENYDPIDGGGTTPKQAKKEISPEEKEKIKQMMRARMKLKEKKTN